MDPQQQVSVRMNRERVRRCRQVPSCELHGALQMPGLEPIKKAVMRQVRHGPGPHWAHQSRKNANPADFDGPDVRARQGTRGLVMYLAC